MVPEGWYLKDGTRVLSAASPSHPSRRYQTIIISTSVSAYLFGDAEGGRQSFVYIWVCKSMNMSMRVSMSVIVDSEWGTVGWIICVFRGLVGSLLHFISSTFVHTSATLFTLIALWVINASSPLMILVKVRQGLTLFIFIHQHYYDSLMPSVYK